MQGFRVSKQLQNSPPTSGKSQMDDILSLIWLQEFFIRYITGGPSEKGGGGTFLGGPRRKV